MRLKYLILIYVLSISTLYAQGEIPKDYFEKPLDIPLLLSGTFGELRSNHFHAGMDIKTKGVTGLAVKASAEGYVGRIKIQHGGYGKALYVYHPNGYQSVYAHLNNFSPKIEALVKKAQYQKESYEIEIFPSDTELKVEQGEIIGYSGNSGSSGGPHLHFEIRDYRSKPMNPFLFGFEDIKDSKKPQIFALHAYPLSPNSHVNGQTDRVQLKLIQRNDGSYRTEPVKAFGTIGFGIDANDILDLTYNKNGIYAVVTKLNGKPVFEARFDKFSFSESRYINRLIDFEYYATERRRIQKLFLEPNNPLSLYKDLYNDGSVTIEKDNLDQSFQILVSDFRGNTQSIVIPLITEVRENLIPKAVKETDYFAKANSASVFEEGKIDVYIPKDALYEDIYLDIDIEGLSVKLHDPTTPLHKSLTLGFDVSQYSPEDQAKLYIASVTPWDSNYYVSTYKKKDRLTTKVNEFGTYRLFEDTKAPTIKPKNFRDKQWVSNFRFLELEIDDEDTGIENYRATVNGEFILMEYDYKTKTLTHDFNDGRISDTKNELKVVVTDKVGNTAIFEAVFFRKN
ncbi:M23 family metallopeptidase [Psychroflexus sp. YR1-1]|uniref:M23 family metallopeptidase n=1 Tax=Psychroflexus aurantiacus TaxID=2709310 RepID=A0A6B3R511_9FLAO|nr:M23 family metallopeptidase [Psychroflexus aurantiacus]NEV94045.1 M23 family metallopeptidase [Psychroflexus aurantiacus]